MINMEETVDLQNILIKMQSDIINSLLLQLMEHITVEEADSLPVVTKINDAAGIRETLERNGLYEGGIT